MSGPQQTGTEKSPEHVLYDASVGLRLVDSHLEELEPGTTPCSCGGAAAEGRGAPGPTGTLAPGGGREGTRREAS